MRTVHDGLPISFLALPVAPHCSAPSPVVVAATGSQLRIFDHLAPTEKAAEEEQRTTPHPACRTAAVLPSGNLIHALTFVQPPCSPSSSSSSSSPPAQGHADPLLLLLSSENRVYLTSSTSAACASQYDTEETVYLVGSTVGGARVVALFGEFLDSEGSSRRQRLHITAVTMNNMMFQWEVDLLDRQRPVVPPPQQQQDVGGVICADGNVVMLRMDPPRRMGISYAVAITASRGPAARFVVIVLVPPSSSPVRLWDLQREAVPVGGAWQQRDAAVAVPVVLPPLPVSASCVLTHLVAL
jgi:hypothetical protein